jgi:hypothetical protein
MNKAHRQGAVYVDRVFSNVSQEIVEITTDKLTLILKDHVSRMETHASWQTPLAIVLTLVLALCTTDTKTAFGLSAEVWTAIFVIVTFLSFIWLLRCAWRARHCPTIEHIITAMKKEP